MATDYRRDFAVEQWFNYNNGWSEQSRYAVKYTERRNDRPCQDIFAQPPFRAWYEAAGPQWLTMLGGKDGGKTTMVTWFVDMMGKLRRAGDPRPICYYYCQDNHTDPVKEMYTALVFALVHELPYLKPMFYEWQQDKEVSTTNLDSILRTLINGLDVDVFIVVDGLDKCEASCQQTILTALSSLYRQKDIVKILLSTQALSATVKELEDKPKICMDFDPDRNAQLVDCQVTKQLTYLSGEVQELVVTRLSAIGRKQGRWTMTHVDHLRALMIYAYHPMKNHLDSLDQTEEH